MKTIDDVRHERLAQLVREIGSATAFAERIERSASQVSQWLNRSPDSKTGKPRRMSSETCRYIEGKLGKPPGWMDREIDLVAHRPDGTVLVAEAKTTSASSDMGRMVELMRLYAMVPEELRPRVFKAVRGVIINLGGISDQDAATAD